MASTGFRLSASPAAAHTQDVKAVAAAGNDAVYSASRDSTVVKWSRTSQEIGGWATSITLTEHSHFVNALAYVPPTDEFPNGLIVSAGSDCTILAYDAANPLLPIYTLVGHESNVCCLGSTSSGNILSGSWDYCAKVWVSGSPVVSVKHPHTVWAIMGLSSKANAPENSFVTACADKLVRLYDGEKLVKTFTGHNEAVRGLAETATGFASCSNDGVIRSWSLDGSCLRELHGHTSFVYTIKSNEDRSVLVSGGEDKTVRVWKDGELSQTIQLPMQSVWSVDILPNGDIVAGGSDGTVRFFTQDESRMATKEQIKAFETEISSQTISSNMVGDLKTDDVEGADALSRPGKKDGETLMVKNEGKVEVYSWSATESSWTKIGDVVDAVGNSRKTTHEGKDYDYVFDINVGDGVPNLKLPFNVTENPYQVAQDFIWKYELPQGYLDQIAQFIVDNAKGVTLGASSTSGYVDPFTGSSRYVPGG